MNEKLKLFSNFSKRSLTHIFSHPAASLAALMHIYSIHICLEIWVVCFAVCFWLGGEESLRSDSDCWRYSHHSFHTLQLAHLNFISFFSKNLNIKKSVVAKSLSPLFSHSLTRFFFYYTMMALEYVLCLWNSSSFLFIGLRRDGDDDEASWLVVDFFYGNCMSFVGWLGRSLVYEKSVNSAEFLWVFSGPWNLLHANSILYACILGYLFFLLAKKN